MTEDNQDVTFQKLIDKHFKENPHSFIGQAFKKTCPNKSLSHDDLEVLKYELGGKIVERVERVDRTKPILLVGSNDAIIKGTLALIWNTHPLIPKEKPLLVPPQGTQNPAEALCTLYLSPILDWDA